MLRRAGPGLLVGAVLMASSGASAGPALVFEPYNGTVFYAEDPDAQWFPAFFLLPYIGLPRRRGPTKGSPETSVKTRSTSA